MLRFQSVQFGRKASRSFPHGLRKYMRLLKPRRSMFAAIGPFASSAADPVCRLPRDDAIASGASAFPAAARSRLGGLESDLASLHEHLQFVRLTGSTVVDHSRLLWQQSPEDFYRAVSAGDAVVRLQGVVDDARSNPGVSRLALSIPPTGRSGFAIDLQFAEAGASAHFGPLHWAFDTEAGAWAWVARALTARYRLRIVSVADRERAWYLEPVPTETGDVLATGNLGLLDAWRKKTTEIRQNKQRFVR